MDTLIDVGALLSVYASLSLACTGLLKILWVLPRRAPYEPIPTR